MLIISCKPVGLKAAAKHFLGVVENQNSLYLSKSKKKCFRDGDVAPGEWITG